MTAKYFFQKGPQKLIQNIILFSLLALNISSLPQPLRVFSQLVSSSAEYQIMPMLIFNRTQVSFWADDNKFKQVPNWMDTISLNSYVGSIPQNLEIFQTGEITFLLYI